MKMRTVPNLLLVLGFILLAGARSLASAQEPQPTADELAQQVSATTTQLRELRGYYQAATDPMTQANFMDQMLGVASNRRQALEALVQHDPSRALHLAFPMEELGQFPPAVQATLEAHVTLEGRLEVLIEDDFEHGSSLTRHSLVAGQDRYALHYAGQPPSSLSGTRVRVQGVKVGHHIGLQGGAP